MMRRPCLQRTGVDSGRTRVSGTSQSKGVCVLGVGVETALWIRPKGLLAGGRRHAFRCYPFRHQCTHTHAGGNAKAGTPLPACPLYGAACNATLVVQITPVRPSPQALFAAHVRRRFHARAVYVLDAMSLQMYYTAGQACARGFVPVMTVSVALAEPAGTAKVGQSVRHTGAADHVKDGRYVTAVLAPLLHASSRRRWLLHPLLSSLYVVCFRGAGAACGTCVTTCGVTTCGMRASVAGFVSGVVGGHLRVAHCRRGGSVWPQGVCAHRARRRCEV